MGYPKCSLILITMRKRDLLDGFPKMLLKFTVSLIQEKRKLSFRHNLIQITVSVTWEKLTVL